MHRIFFIFLCQMLILIPLKFYSQTLTHSTLPVDLKDFLATPENERDGSPPLPFIPDFRNIDKDRKIDFKSTPFPSVYDLRELGLVTSVKDQSSAPGLNTGGNCWAFTTIGAIESQWLTLGYDSFNLSEHSLSSCHGFEWPYGDGGNDWLAMAYLTRLEGPVLESQVPYTPNDQPSHACVEGFTPVAYVPEVRWIPGNNEDALKYTLMNFGAVSVSMRWQTPSYNSQNHTFLYSGNKAVNHAVLLCGWNDTLITDVGKGAWIIKNQWTDEWADSGYFYISYEDSRTNYTASYYPEKVPVNRIDKIYYYDTLSALRSTGYLNSTGYALSRFSTAKEEFIHRIGTFIPVAGTIIDITAYQNFSDDSLSGILFEKKDIYNELPGFYTFPVNFTANGDFYIRIKYETPGSHSPIPIEIPIDDYAQPNLQGAEGKTTPTYQTTLKINYQKPVITHSIPADSTTGIPPDIPFKIYLDNPVDSFSLHDIILQKNDLTTKSPKEFSYDSVNYSLQITFDSLHDYGQEYKLIFPENTFFHADQTGNLADTLTFFLIDSNLFYPLDYANFQEGIQTSDNQLLLCMTDTIDELYDSLISISRTFMVKDNPFDLDYDLDMSVDQDNPCCFAIEMPVSYYGENIHIHFADSAIQSVKQHFNTDFSYTFKPECKRIIINSSLPTEETKFFHPDSAIYVKFAGKFDAINPNQIEIVNTSYDIWRTVNWEYEIDTGNQQLKIVSDSLSGGDDYNIMFKNNSLEYQGENLTGSTSLTFGTSGRYILAPGNLNLYETHILSPQDTSLYLQFMPQLEWASDDTVLIINKLTGDSIWTQASIKGGNTIEIPLANLEEGSLYDVLIPSDALRTKGNTWISPDNKEWIPTGVGNKGHEFHTCIRAYSDTSSASSPYALFDVNSRFLCIGSSVIFSDLSKGDIDSYVWDFGDGATPATANGVGPHEVLYESEGVKTVRLIVSGNEGADTTVAHNLIHVKSGIDIIAESREIEIGTNESLTITLDGADEFEWLPTYWIDTTRGPSVTFESPIEGDYTYYIKGIQGACSTYDSINISVINRPPNDNVCNASEVTLGINGILDEETGKLLPFTNRKATVEEGEPHPPGTDCTTQSTWCFNVPLLAYSVWFTFTAPPSGKISINTTDEYTGQQKHEFDNKIALYEADTCTDILTDNYTLIAANDDYHDATRSYSAKITLRNDLIPGKRYWIQFDGSFGGIEGDFYLTLSDGTVDIKNIKTDAPFSIHPNPFNETLNISSSNNEYIENMSIEIHSIEGKMIYSKYQTGAYISQINTSQWKSGVYVVKIRTKNHTYQQLIVKE